MRKSKQQNDNDFTLITSVASMNATAQHLAPQHLNSVHSECCCLAAQVAGWLLHRAEQLRSSDNIYQQEKNFPNIELNVKSLEIRKPLRLSYGYDCIFLKYQQSISSTGSHPPSHAAAAALGHYFLRTQSYLQKIQGLITFLIPR